MRQAESPPGTLLFFVRRLVLCGALVISVPLPRLHAQNPAVSGSEYTFRREVDLLSVPVRVTDRNDNEIHGLTANQFSLYEDGKQQKISFFDAKSEPVSLGILLDVSGSMASSGKLAQAKDALFRVVGTMRPTDEMFYLWFHLEIGKAVGFASDPYPIVAAISATPVTVYGTSLYDAIARGLCYMRKARHHRQALLVVTDGADQNSHRSLQELVPIVQASQAQVFIVGCLGKEEYDLFRVTRHERVPLVSRQEIDNPLTAFNRLARESGAEAFFPASPGKIQEAVDAVAHQLRTQYTLAYYPKVKGGGFHRIEVKVAQSGAQVRARRGFARVEYSAGQGPPQQAAGCEDEKLRPYPYDSKITAKNGRKVYQEDFQNVSSGWPNKRGYHYKAGTYEIVNEKPRSDPNYAFDYDNSSFGSAGVNIRTQEVGGAIPLEGVLVANGPLFEDLNASVTVEWKSDARKGDQPTAPGLVFRLDNRGYYAVLVTGDPRDPYVLAFKLVKKFHSEPMARDLIPWKDFPLSERIPHRQETISVQCRGPVITLVLQGTAVAQYEDVDFKEGIVGMILFGEGRAVFRDLLVEEAHDAGLRLPLSHEPGPH